MAPMATMLDEAQRLIGHKFDNTQVLWEALSAAGSASSAPDGNKRLALLGDVVLKFVVLNNWFKSGKPRGIGNHLVSTLGSNTNLDRVGRELGLTNLINNNPSQHNVVNPATMAATVEAVIAAVYLDAGIEAASAVINTLGLVQVGETPTAHWSDFTPRLADRSSYAG